MRYLGIQEKSKSRKLWEQVFSEDSSSFLDYYYSYKTKDNEVLVIEEDADVISMLHRNPLRMYLKGEDVPAEYIVAVATREDRRSRGLMRSLLYRSMQDANAAGIPFQFLMPAAEAIYTPYGFRYISKRPKKTEVFWEQCGLTERDVRKDEYGELASFVNICLSADGGLFVQRDAAYFARLQAERESDGGGVRVLFDAKGVMTGYYSYYTGEEPEITEAVFLPRFQKAHQKPETDQVPHLMARITSLRTFLHCFTIPGAISEGKRNRLSGSPAVYLDVADTIIPENHGHFLWSFGESRSHLMPLDIDRRAALRESGHKQHPAVRVDIADLGSWLFGYRPFDELTAEGLIVGPEESLEVLRKVKPLQHIFIREEV